jgi:hypothetical protein
LVQAIKADSQRAKQNHRSAKSLLAQNKFDGYYAGCVASSPLLSVHGEAEGKVHPPMYCSRFSLTGAKKILAWLAPKYLYIT